MQVWSRKDYASSFRTFAANAPVEVTAEHNRFELSEEPDESAFEPEILEARQQLKSHWQLQVMARKFWAILPKSEHASVSRNAFMEFVLHVCRVLQADLSDDDCRNLATEEIFRQLGSSTSISFHTFSAYLFDLADSWTTDISVLQYVEFLDTVFRRLSVAHVAEAPVQPRDRIGAILGPRDALIVDTKFDFEMSASSSVLSDQRVWFDGDKLNAAQTEASVYYSLCSQSEAMPLEAEDAALLLTRRDVGWIKSQSTLPLTAHRVLHSISSSPALFQHDASTAFSTYAQQAILDADARTQAAHVRLMAEPTLLGRGKLPSRPLQLRGDDVISVDAQSSALTIPASPAVLAATPRALPSARAQAAVFGSTANRLVPPVTPRVSSTLAAGPSGSPKKASPTAPSKPISLKLNIPSTPAASSSNGPLTARSTAALTVTPRIYIEPVTPAPLPIKLSSALPSTQSGSIPEDEDGAAVLAYRQRAEAELTAVSLRHSVATSNYVHDTLAVATVALPSMLDADLIEELEAAEAQEDSQDLESTSHQTASEDKDEAFDPAEPKTGFVFAASGQQSAFQHNRLQSDGGDVLACYPVPRTDPVQQSTENSSEAAPVPFELLNARRAAEVRSQSRASVVMRDSLSHSSGPSQPTVIESAKVQRRSTRDMNRGRTHLVDDGTCFDASRPAVRARLPAGCSQTDENEAAYLSDDEDRARFLMPNSGPAASSKTAAHDVLVSPPLGMWIMGAPLSGKSIVARSLEQRLGLVRITPIALARRCVQEWKATGLKLPDDRQSMYESPAPISDAETNSEENHVPLTPAQRAVWEALQQLIEMQNSVVSGDTVDSRARVWASALLDWLASNEVATRGYVIEGFPEARLLSLAAVPDAGAFWSSPEHREAATRLHGHWPPPVVVDLQLDDAEVQHRCALISASIPELSTRLESLPSRLKRYRAERSMLARRLETLTRGASAVSVLSSVDTAVNSPAQTLDVVLLAAGDPVGPFPQARHVSAPAALADQSVSISSAQLLIDNALTSWQKWCPVALATQKALHLGSDDHCVCYRGKLYYLESERARQLFMAHPAKYLCVPPALPSNFVVAVLVSGGCADLGAVATALAAPYGWRAVDASDGKLLTRPIVDAALDLYFTKSRTLAQAAVAAYQPALPTSDTTAASLKTAALEEERRLGDVLMALSQVEQADVPSSATAPASLRATRESTGLVIKLNTLSLDNDSIKGGSAASGLAVEKLVTDKEAAGVLDRRRLRHSAHARSQLDHLHARGIVPDLVIRLVNSSVPLDIAEGPTPTQIGWEEFEKVLTLRGVASAQIDLALDANEPQDAKALANVALHRAVCRIRARMDPFVARAQPVPVSELSVNTIRQRMQLLRDSIEPRDGTAGSPTGSSTIEALCARTACVVCLIDGDRVVSSSTQHVLRLLPSQTLTACCSAACASKIIGVPGALGVGAPIKRYSITRNPFAPPPRLIVMGGMGVGKTTHAKRLAAQHKLVFTTLSQLLPSSAAPLLTAATSGAAEEQSEADSASLRTHIENALLAFSTLTNTLNARGFVLEVDIHCAAAAHAIIAAFARIGLTCAMPFAVDDVTIAQARGVAKLPPPPRPKTKRPLAPSAAELAALTEDGAADAAQAAHEQAVADWEAACAAQVAEAEAAGQRRMQRAVDAANLIESSLRAAGVHVFPTVSTDDVEQVVVFKTRVFDSFADVGERQQLFCKGHRLAAPEARSLLDSGRKVLSSAIGQRCAVCLHQSGRSSCQLQPLRLPREGESSSVFGVAHPVLLRHHVLFACSAQHQSELARSPYLYTSNLLKSRAASPDHIGNRSHWKWSPDAVEYPNRLGGVLAPCISVLGLSNQLVSLSSTLSSQLANWTGAICVTVPMVLQTLLDECFQKGADEHALRQRLPSPQSALASEVCEVLCSAKPVSDSLCARAVAVFSRRIECRIRGIVLDGFPRNAHQAALLHSCGVHVQNMFMVHSGNPADLNSTSTFELGVQLNSCNQTICMLNASEQSAWALLNRAQSEVETAYRLRRNHVSAVSSGSAASLASMPIVPSAFRAQLSKSFRNYCPVCVGRHNALRQCTADDDDLGDMANALEFRGRVFRCCSSACVAAFVQTPIAFVGPRLSDELDEGGRYRLPAATARRLAPHEAAQLQAVHLQLRGYCPVALKRSLDRQITGAFDLKLGVEACGAVFESKVFLMSGERELLEFMRQPSKYASVKLPAKTAPATPRVAPVDLLAQGKLFGFLEQTVANDVSACMIALDSNRYKHPALSVGQTAILQLALRLKATDAKARDSQRQRWLQRLKQFIDDCVLLEQVEPRYASDGVANQAAKTYDQLSQLNFAQVRAKYLD